MIPIELTLCTKNVGPLTKKISLDAKTGAMISDGAACLMTAGTAQSVMLAGMADFAKLISELKSNQALALGALRDELPQTVQIVTKGKLNGSTRPDLIARTSDNIQFRPGHPALVLCDYDCKGMPLAVAARIEELGGFEAALTSVLPELPAAARLTRASTSTGLYRVDTRERLPESGGEHLYVVAQDGGDSARFLAALHERCWLAGLGWYVVGAGGHLLERSIVDRLVGAPERLVFEAPPVLVPPLAQDAERRRPRPRAGEAINTLTACPDLTATEKARLQELRAGETAQLGLEVRAARAAFIHKQAKRIVERTGMSPEAAARVVEQQCDGTLLPAVELHFDDPDLAGKTVVDVLADPDSYVGETLSDPLEGVSYGRNKAKILRRSNGSLLIHSFAHGRTIYKQKDDGAAAAKPITVVAGERHLAADAGIAALRAAGTAFYQRDKSLVRVCEVRARSSAGDIILVPGIVAVTPAILERALGQTAQWERYDIKKKGMVRTDPPRPVISQIMDMAGEWPFPPLAGVIGCPTLRPDGSLLSREGYDLATGLVLISAVIMPRLSDCPTREEAEAAAALLESLLDEFPFATPIDRAVAMSVLLTPVLRGAMAVAPIHLVSAAEAGSGKSYLADVSSTIATGEKAAAVAVAPKPEETEKRLIGAALAGHPIISLDNCRETLEGDFLCQVSERPLLQLRSLGKSDPIRATNTFSVFANGNNLHVADDTVRRTIRCALDANVENPETRVFAGNPVAAIRRNRGAYVTACLTIALSYIAAGKPNRLPPLASYEGWSDIVRSPLVWLGYDDPVKSMAATRGADPVRQDRARVFDIWKDPTHGLGITNAHTVPEIIEYAEVRPKLAGILVDIAQKHGAMAGTIEPRRLGRWLTKHENTIVDGFKLTVDRTDAARPRYRLAVMPD